MPAPLLVAMGLLLTSICGTASAQNLSFPSLNQPSGWKDGNADRSRRSVTTWNENDSIAALLAIASAQDDTSALSDADLPEPPKTIPSLDSPDGSVDSIREFPGESPADATVNAESPSLEDSVGMTDPGFVQQDRYPGTVNTQDLGRALTISDVIASVYRSYPEISAARLELNRAGGDLLSAYGAYDTKLQAYSLNEPTGFYENYRQGIGVARQTWWGGYVSAGYRIGRGFYQPWYLERQTDDGGEFKIAFQQPLLRGRAIDPQRVAVFQASLQQNSAAPIVQLALLNISREASLAYWEWVEAGAVLEAQLELLKIAEIRQSQFEDLFKAGSAAGIDVLLNRQLLAERRASAFETEQKYREKALKLGLYLRDERGRPMPPDSSWLPGQFPEIEAPPESTLRDDLAAALVRRPEPQLLDLDIRSLQWDRRLACNDLLPTLDFVSELSQDLGEPGTKSDDKDELLLVIGIQSEVPIQRRKARGKIQSTTAKIAQTQQKRRLVRDKIANELYTAHNQLLLSSEAISQYELALRTAVDTLDRYRFAFDRGNLDLIQLNLLETKLNEIEIKLVKAQRTWFSSLADMQAALGLDPLEQAMLVTSMPLSDRPGPGNLPEGVPLDREEFDQDWKLHRQGVRNEQEEPATE